MLEKREQSTAMIMVALGDRKCAGDRLAPTLIVQELRIVPDLAKLPGRLTFEGDDGSAVGDQLFLSIFVLPVYVLTPDCQPIDAYLAHYPLAQFKPTSARETADFAKISSHLGPAMRLSSYRFI
jgi:hypothetical protein